MAGISNDGLMPPPDPVEHLNPSLSKVNHGLVIRHRLLTLSFDTWDEHILQILGVQLA